MQEFVAFQQHETILFGLELSTRTKSFVLIAGKLCVFRNLKFLEKKSHKQPIRDLTLNPTIHRI
jgi:hypothetical protein